GPEELEAIREAGIGAAVLLAFDPRRPHESLDPEARLRILGGLLEKASAAGVENVLVDAVVLDPGSIALSAAAVSMVRRRLGLPAGCAPANALGPVSKKTHTPLEVAGIHGGTAAMLRAMGADFIMYGPLRRIKYVAPAAAVVDAYLGYLALRRGERIPRSHPTRRILRDIQRLFAKGG
ncbi:MAG: tetrahydromethanopterin S-methyltransferase subunit H, partial [Candidatus Korarchaeota archaeon]|nr:tetrahydromethanopterin S-methyltransferase subunit H [Candidatus Korarchaeota archaeon]